MNKIEFSKNDCDKIVDMYKNGISSVKIGEYFSCSKTPIKNILNNRGIILDTPLRKISKDDYKNIVNMYNSGMTQKEIAEFYNCSKETICNIMKKIGVKVRSNGFTQEDSRKMYDMYINGLSLKEIAKEFNTTMHTIGNALRRNNFYIDKKRYHCDENYFDSINTRDKAYIIGLLWADGHNSVDIGKVNIQLQECDKHILEDISFVTKSDMPLWLCNLHSKNKNWQNAYTLTWRSRHMSNVLYSYGMFQQKSLILKFPEWIEEELYLDFIRGYFDGDGSVSFNEINGRVNVNMIGTLMMLESIQKILNVFGIKSGISLKNNSNIIGQLYITNIRDKIKFLNYIYNDSNLKINRKFQKYQQILKYYNNINNSLVS